MIAFGQNVTERGELLQRVLDWSYLGSNTAIPRTYIACILPHEFLNQQSPAGSMPGSLQYRYSASVFGSVILA